MKHNSLRKNSYNNSKPFDSNFLNANNNNCYNNIEKIGIKTLNINKLIIGNNDKTPEKKNHLKSINRVPSANTSKNRNSYSMNSKLNKGNHLFYSHNNKIENNIFFEDLNYQIININDINKSSIINQMMAYTGKEIFKDITSNENINNHINKDVTYAHSSKLISNFLKNGSKSVKKKECYFNVSNKITINAKGNEINKSNK